MRSRPAACPANGDPLRPKGAEHRLRPVRASRAAASGRTSSSVCRTGDEVPARSGSAAKSARPPTGGSASSAYRTPRPKSCGLRPAPSPNTRDTGRVRNRPRRSRKARESVMGEIGRDQPGIVGGRIAQPGSGRMVRKAAQNMPFNERDSFRPAVVGNQSGA